MSPLLVVGVIAAMALVVGGLVGGKWHREAGFMGVAVAAATSAQLLAVGLVGYVVVHFLVKYW